MARGKKFCCLVLSDSDSDSMLTLEKNEEIEFLHVEYTKKAIFIIQNYIVDCVILQKKQQPEDICDIYQMFSSKFPSIPILVILDKHQIELACRLGQLGVNHIVATTDRNKIETLLQQIL